MGEVVTLPGLTTLPIPVSRVLDGAKDAEYVMVISLVDGRLQVASSEGNLHKMVFLASKFVSKALRGDYDGT